MTILQIEMKHFQTLLTLELFHRDPFDHVIISQGISDNFTILTSDKQFKITPASASGNP